MLGFSSVSLLGSVVRVESRQTTGGTWITTVTLAGDVPGRDPSRVIPFYQQVQLIGKTAELYANAPVGAVAFAQGTVRQDRWADKNDPSRTQSAVRVTANLFGLIDGEFDKVADARGQERLAYGRNEVMLTGNLTRDADHRVTTNGNPLTRLSVAVNGLRGKEPYVSYFDISAWGDLAMQTANLQKGNGVVVWCTIQNQTWDDRLTGEKRYGTGFDARDVLPVMTSAAEAVTPEGEPAVTPARASTVTPAVPPAAGLRSRPQATPQPQVQATPPTQAVDAWSADEEIDWDREMALMDEQVAAAPVTAPAARPQATPARPQVATRPQGTVTQPRPQAPAPTTRGGMQGTTRVSAPLPTPKRAPQQAPAFESELPEDDTLPF